IEHGVAARRQMQMVTALHRERDRIAERTEYQVGPRPERHHGLTCAHGAIPSIDAPSTGVLFQRTRLASEEASAPALEQRGIGLGQSTGVWNESGRRPMQ